MVYMDIERNKVVIFKFLELTWVTFSYLSI